MPRTSRAQRLDDLEAFLDRYGYVIENALNVHIERMEEASNACAIAGYPNNLSRAFDESADKSRKAKTELLKFTEGDDDE